MNGPGGGELQINQWHDYQAITNATSIAEPASRQARSKRLLRSSVWFFMLRSFHRMVSPTRRFSGPPTLRAQALRQSALWR